MKKNEKHWYPFRISDKGVYDDRCDTYTIVSVIDPDTVLVTFDDEGEMNMLKLEGNELKVYNPAMKFIRITAVKTSSSGVDEFSERINGIGLKDTKSGRPFLIDEGTYTHDRKEYDIARVDGDIATVGLKTGDTTFIFKHELRIKSFEYHELKPNSTESDRIIAD